MCVCVPAVLFWMLRVPFSPFPPLPIAVNKFYNATYPKDFVDRHQRFQGNLSSVRAMQLWNDWNVEAHRWAVDHPDQVDYMMVRVEDLVGLNGVPKRLEVLHALADFVGSPLTPAELCCLSLQRTKDKGASAKNAGQGGPGGGRFPANTRYSGPRTPPHGGQHIGNTNVHAKNGAQNPTAGSGTKTVGSGFGARVRDAVKQWQNAHNADGGEDGAQHHPNDEQINSNRTNTTTTVYITPIRVMGDDTTTSSIQDTDDNGSVIPEEEQDGRLHSKKAPVEEEEQEEEEQGEDDHRRKLGLSVEPPVGPVDSQPPSSSAKGGALPEATIKFLNAFLARVDFWKENLVPNASTIDDANDVLKMGKELGVRWKQFMVRVQREGGEDAVADVAPMFDIDEIERLMDVVKNKIHSGALRPAAAAGKKVVVKRPGTAPAIKEVTKRYGKWQAVLEKDSELAAFFYSEGEAGLRLFGYHPYREIQYGRVNSSNTATNTTTSTPSANATTANATTTTTTTDKDSAATQRTYQCNVNDPALKSTCLPQLPKPLTPVAGGPKHSQEMPHQRKE
jgi:hypothetical protein